MNAVDLIPDGGYSHDLLIHDTVDELVAATTAFVERGLDSGGRVLVHSSAERVALLRSAVGLHPRLEYALDRDLYVTPMSTLFGYERSLAQRDESGDLWVTGTVPFGSDEAAHPAWTRYESLVNEVLGAYPFHALCTYDTRALPAATIAAARATHPCLSDGVHRAESSSYVEPGEFLADPRAQAPRPPQTTPTATVVLRAEDDLSAARRVILQFGGVASAVARETIDGFAVAVNEVLENGLRHGRPPVELTLWADTTRLTCVVVDQGTGIGNPLTGYRYREPDGPTGLWVARQFCEELVIRDAPTGTSVFMSTG